MRVAVEFADAVKEFEPVTLPHTYRPAPVPPNHADVSVLSTIAADSTRFVSEHEAARRARIDAFDAWLRAESLRTAPGYFGAVPGVLTPTRLSSPRTQTPQTPTPQESEPNLI